MSLFVVTSTGCVPQGAPGLGGPHDKDEPEILGPRLLFPLRLLEWRRRRADRRALRNPHPRCSPVEGSPHTMHPRHTHPEVQQEFFWVERDNSVVKPASFSDLRAGDAFALHSLVPAGSYTAASNARRASPFSPLAWHSTASELVKRQHLRLKEGRPQLRFPVGRHRQCAQ
jgi:hypothetical protein